MRHSLFFKLFLPITFLFILVIIAVAVVTPELVRRNAETDALETAQRTVNQLKTLRAYYVKNVIKKVLGKGGIKSSFNYENDPDTIPLPATMIHDLSKLYSGDGTTVSLYSPFPFPNRASRQLDNFGRQAWKTLSSNPNTVVTRIDTIKGEPVMRVAIADRMVSKACVSCHNSRADTPRTDWKLGDVRGVLEVDLSIASALARGKSIEHTLLSVILAAMIIAYLILLFIYRKFIGSRLKILLEVLQNISEGDGDLTRRLPEGGKDEISRIAKSFNRFADSMRNTVSRISEITRQLSDSSSRLAEINDASGAAVHNQGSETNQIATAINEMAAAAEEVNRHAAEAAQSSAETDANTQTTQHAVNAAISDIQQLSSKLEAAAGTMTQLQEGAQNVGGVIDVIRGIAEQTNLLALNAAIEAARAGDQGRGFAVVADEVRTLAARTQKSTEEIRDMIEKLQEISGKAVDTMEQSQQQAGHSVTQASHAGESLNSIVQSISSVNDINTQIAAASEEQSQVVASIDQSITAIKDLSEQTATHVTQSGNLSNDLAGIAAELQIEVNRFKV
ncbi:MAG TPA: methyl-accepting chemotaxis protein [Gammaproteobacteria bacterium]|nr:methyl-accepting chemotaxis protein [Gammaproteobacteria bacterium]